MGYVNVFSRDVIIKMGYSWMTGLSV